jgi:hypothetical protein
LRLNVQSQFTRRIQANPVTTKQVAAGTCILTDYFEADPALALADIKISDWRMQGSRTRLKCLRIEQQGGDM